MLLCSRRVYFIFLFFIGLPPATAQEPIDEYMPELSLKALLEIDIAGAAVRDLGLGQAIKTANPFELSAMQLPLSVEVINSRTMRARGLKTVTEAAEHLVGVISGESPAEPSSFSMRGFIRDSVIVLRDGIRLGPASMTMRPHNTFNLQQVEILKGPASLHFAAPTASGIINMITKKPVIGQESATELFGAYSRFDSSEWGIGRSGPVTDKLAYRVDINRAASNGWVDDTDSYSFNITASMLWQVSPSLDMLLSFDYLDDDLPAYWGTPLVPAPFSREPISGIINTDNGSVLDQQLRFNNYNIDDQRSDSEHLWSKITANWQPSSRVKVKNTLFHFSADRAWKNAESYVFNPQTSLLDRDRFFVFHDHQFYGNQLDINIEHLLGQVEHQLTIGLDYARTDFERARGFPDGDSVDPYQPVAGLFGPLDKRLSPTKIDEFAIMVEDTVFLNDDWHLSLGIRKDFIDTTRDNFDENGIFIVEDSFKRTFKPTSYRLASSYQLTENLSVYGQFSTGHDPVGSNIYLVNANENFDFTDISQLELGVKSVSADGNIEMTSAIYKTKRENILLLVTHDSVGNSGSQVAKGIEFAASGRLSQNWRVGGNFAYTRAKYEDYLDPDFGVDASGNTPPNVPKWVANAWFSVNNIAGLPLELGGGVRYISKRHTNFENTVTLQDYMVVNAFAAYTLDKLRISINARNILDEDYAPWGDIFYPNQIGIAPPRAVELSFQTKF
ncbi:TonB-dependent receptor [Thalassomonas actiniarum]|uniref:TonB-dependent receptor n=1 Tax=Thalassomonas actiniarum TaxID=485447 RepID=A0AAF0BX36_9GAMM|nr:TonB-dependent receptor [Thalassomonas actiniarum]WDD96891.1 TonB-dependent receptor [Thalassomonas actiniarum]